MLDPDKVRECVALCSGARVDASSSLAHVTEVANNHGLQLTQEELSAAAQDLLALS